MNVIEVASDANFLVGVSGLRLTASNKTVVEFYQGERIKIVNKNQTPYIEFINTGTNMSVKINSKQDLAEVLKRVDHDSEFRTETRDLMNAFAASEKEVTTEELLDAYSASLESQQNQVNKQLEFTRRVGRLTVEDKLKLVVAFKSSFKESTEVLLTAIADASDQDLGYENPGASPEEIDGGAVAADSGKTVAEDEMAKNAAMAKAAGDPEA